MALTAIQKKRKRREEILELTKKGYTPEFIQFAYFAMGQDDVTGDLEKIQDFTGGGGSNQVEIDGMKFDINTLSD